MSIPGPVEVTFQSVSTDTPNPGGGTDYILSCTLEGWVDQTVYGTDSNGLTSLEDKETVLYGVHYAQGTLSPQFLAGKRVTRTTVDRLLIDIPAGWPQRLILNGSFSSRAWTAPVAKLVGMNSYLDSFFIGGSDHVKYISLDLADQFQTSSTVAGLCQGIRHPAVSSVDADVATCENYWLSTQILGRCMGNAVSSRGRMQSIPFEDYWFQSRDGEERIISRRILGQFGNAIVCGLPEWCLITWSGFTFETSYDITFKVLWYDVDATLIRTDTIDTRSVTGSGDGSFTEGQYELTFTLTPPTGAISWGTDTDVDPSGIGASASFKQVPHVLVGPSLISPWCTDPFIGCGLIE